MFRIYFVNLWAFILHNLVCVRKGLLPNKIYFKIPNSEISIKKHKHSYIVANLTRRSIMPAVLGNFIFNYSNAHIIVFIWLTLQ